MKPAEKKTHLFAVAGAKLRVSTYHKVIAASLRRAMYKDMAKRGGPVFDLRLYRDPKALSRFPRLDLAKDRDSVFRVDTSGRILWKYRPYGLCVLANPKKRSAKVWIEAPRKWPPYALAELLLVLPSSFLFRDWKRHTFHCGIVTRGGKGLIFFGNRFAGKTTLCLSLVKRGWKLLSDETNILWHEDGLFLAAPFSRKQQLKKFSLRRFPELQAKKNRLEWSSDEKFVIPLAWIRPRARSLQSPLARLIFLRYSKKGKYSTRVLKNPDELPALLHRYDASYARVGAQREFSLEQFLFLRRMIQRLKPVEITYSDKQRQRVLRLLENL